MPSARTLTAAFALGRLAFGAGLLARPAQVAAGWLGEDAERQPVQIVIRAVGARDIALSAGTLAALGEPSSLRRWLAGAILSDLCDTVATLATPGSALPGNARWGTAALGGGSALAGAALLATVSR
ncbi:MAG: hypothetical protein ACR2GL_08925 [Thermoleophilaceae bacterium]